MIPAKTRLQYARGYLALEMFEAARAELDHVATEDEKIFGDVVLLRDAIGERAMSLPRDGLATEYSGKWSDPKQHPRDH